MTRPYVWQLNQSGAADGQVVTWDNTLMRWVPADVGGAFIPAGDITLIDQVTQAEYDALTPVATTLYVVVG